MAGYRSPSARRAAADASGKPNPTLKPLGLEGTAKVGVASTIGIIQATPGSTITVQSGFLPAGMTLNSAARTITGTPQVAGSLTFTLRETLAGATNTPRDTAQTVVTATVSPARPALDAAATSAAAWAAAQGVLPTGRAYRIAAIGDSRVKALYQDGPTSPQISTSAMSPLNWANALLGQRFMIGDHWGVSAETTTQMLARIDAAVASGAGILYIQGGVNDYSGGAAVPSVVANIITMAEKGRAANMIVVIEAEVGSTSLNPAAVAKLPEHNRLLRQYSDVTPGVFVHDARPVMLSKSAASNTVGFNATYAYDVTHANGRGSYQWGKSLAVLLGPLVAPRSSPLINNPVDADPANGRWQLATNPTFITATGGTLANNATGAAPSSWSAGPESAGATCAVSMEANAIGNSTVFDCTFSTAGQLCRMAQGSALLPNVQNGDVVQLVSDVEIVTPGVLAGLYGHLDLTIGGSSKTVYALYSDATTAYYGPDEACRYTILSRPFLITGPVTAAVASVKAAARAAGNAKWKVHQCGVIRRSDGGY